MKLSEIKDALNAAVFVGHEQLDMQVEGGAASDLMSDLLRLPREGAVLLTGLTSIQVIRTSVISGIVAVVFVRGKRPDQEMIAHAREHDLPLLSSPFNMYTSCGRLFSKGLKSIRENREEGNGIKGSPCRT
jgi:predicted transcriptional regulator